MRRLYVYKKITQSVNLKWYFHVELLYAKGIRNVGLLILANRSETDNKLYKFHTSVLGGIHEGKVNG